MFKLDNLTPFANNGKTNKPVLWLFYNEFNDTITSDNFITERTGIKQGDQIMVISEDKKSNKWYNVNIVNKIIKLIENV